MKRSHLDNVGLANLEERTVTYIKMPSKIRVKRSRATEVHHGKLVRACCKSRNEEKFTGVCFDDFRTVIIDHAKLLLILQKWRWEHAEKSAPAFFHKLLGSSKRSGDGILNGWGDNCIVAISMMASIIPEARNSVTGFQYAYL